MQFGHVQIPHDSFVRLIERMIVQDSFSVSRGNQGGLTAMATALLSFCEEQQSNNLDEYSDNSDAESEKSEKNLKKQATRGGVVVWYAT